MGKKDWNCRIPKNLAFGIASTLWAFIFVLGITKLAVSHTDILGFLVALLMFIAIIMGGGFILLFWQFYNVED